MRDRSVSPSQSPTHATFELSWHNHYIRWLWVLLAGTTRVDGQNLSTSSLRTQGPITPGIDEGIARLARANRRHHGTANSRGTTTKSGCYGSCLQGRRELTEKISARRPCARRDP